MLENIKLEWIRKKMRIIDALPLEAILEKRLIAVQEMR
jgi:hypothetical protein